MNERIEKLRIEFNEKITQLGNNTKLEIEKIRAETKQNYKIYFSIFYYLSSLNDLLCLINDVKFIINNL